MVQTCGQDEEREIDQICVKVDGARGRGYLEDGLKNAMSYWGLNMLKVVHGLEQVIALWYTV